MPPSAAAPLPPLAGRCVVVTRPRHQAAELLAGLASVGAEALLHPLLEIEPAGDPAPLADAVARLDDYRFAAFVSPNAVAHALPAILRAGAWPAGLQALAVGPGTVRALADYGVTGTIAPSLRFDSEALLALPVLADTQVRGCRVAIFRGDGGRELLADTLRARGATVDCVTCYRRLPPPAGSAPLLALWRRGRFDAMTISSSEGLRNLVDALDAVGLAYLRATPLFVPHARIAENARACGLSRVVVTPPGDDGLLAGLSAYNWPPGAPRPAI